MHESIKVIIERMNNAGETKDYKDGYDEALEHFVKIIEVLNKLISEES